MGNIIYITHYDPDDERSLSGTIHSVYRELKVNKLGISVYHIDGGLVEKSGQLLNRLLRSIGIAVDCRFTTLFAMIVGLYLSFRVMFFPHATIVAIVASHYTNSH